MVINIVVNPVAGGWSPWSERLGGTEESVIEWATRLKERGHDVTVFHNGEHGDFKGVSYVDRSRYLDRAPGVTLNCNYPDLSPLEPTIYFNNLTTAQTFDLAAFRSVIHPSQYARDSLALPHPHQFVVPHGYDPQRIYPDDKVPFRVLYASSPDRGLSELAWAWPEVVKVIPEAELIVTYGGELDAPNVVCVGSVSADFMDELYRTSDVWVHPCLGGELFGITAVKAQVAGCVPVYYPTMALAETVKVGQRSSPRHLVEDLITVLGDEKFKNRLRDQLSRTHFVDWDESTTMLEAVLAKA